MSAPADGLASPHTSSASTPPVEPPRTSAAASDGFSGKKPPHLSRTQILDATDACLVTYGYDGTTIRRIAKQLDCAVGSIYRYFTDKRELLSAVTQRRFEPVETATEAGLAMDQVYRMYSRIADEQPEQYRLMFWLASVGKASAGRHLPATIEKLLQLWGERLGDRRQAEFQWAQLHGHLMLGRDNRETEETSADATATAPVEESAQDAAV